MSAWSRSGRGFDAVLGSALGAAGFAAVLLGWLILVRRGVPAAVWLVAVAWALLSAAAANVVTKRYWQGGGGAVVTPTLAYLRHVLGGLAVAAVLLIVGTLVATQVVPDDVPPGQPGIVNGQYVLNDHGDETVVSKATYDRASASRESGFVGVALIFSLAAAFGSAATGERLADRRR